MILVMQSYANAALSVFEDPEKILEQAVLEMNDDLTKMRQATAQVSYICLFSFFFGLFVIFLENCCLCYSCVHSIIIHLHHCFVCLII
jgi:hypothetical protein